MCSTSMAVECDSIGGPAGRGCTLMRPCVGAGGFGVGAGARFVSRRVMWVQSDLVSRLQPLEPTSGIARQDRAEQYEPHQDECTGPRLAMPLLIGRDGIGEDLNREGQR